MGKERWAKIKVFFKTVFFNSKIKLSIFINKNERGIDFSPPLLPTMLMGNTGGLRFKDK